MKKTIKHPKETSKIIGHNKYRELLKNSFQNNLMHHGWLVSGPKSIGKATIVYEFVKSILKDQNGVEKIIANSHPDLFILEKTEIGAKEISVDDVREVSKFLSLKPVLSDYKFVIIDPVDDLNINAANALLKILEEPPQNSFIFLISHNPDSLLTTIISRCQHINLGELSEQEALEIVADNIDSYDKEVLGKFVRLASNSPGLAMNIISYNGIQIYKDFLAVITDFPNVNILQINDFAENIGANKHSNNWNLFTFFFGFTIQRVIKIVLGIKIEGEYIQGEKEALEKIASKTELNDMVFLAESADSLMRSAEISHLDKKKVICVLLQIFKEALEKGKNNDG